MHRFRFVVRAAMLAIVTGAVASPFIVATIASAAGPPSAETPAGLASPASSGRAGAGTDRRTIEVWMAGRPLAAQRFVDAVSTPGSPLYRRYLTPSAYTARLGPPVAQVRAVRSFLIRSGFTSVHVSVGDDYVSATASISTINRTLTDGSFDPDLAGPAGIGHDILGVSGVSDGRAHASGPASEPGGPGQTARSNGPDPKQPCSSYWAQQTTPVIPAFDGVSEAAIPVCGYSADQMRSAYGLTSTDTGAGTRVALIEVGAPIEMFRALSDYARANGLHTPRRENYRQETVDVSGHRGKCLDQAVTEAPEDSDALYAMAPGATQLMVDGCDTGDDFDQALFDAELAPLTGRGSRPSATIELTTFGLGEERGVAASQLKISHAIALRAAAEGVSLFVSSGDQPGVESQASDPDVTAVGGTTLGIGPHGQREFETGWLTRFGERRGTSGPWSSSGAVDIGAGGGVSDVYREPSYQRGVVPDALSEDGDGHAGRAIPDIAADADDYSGMLLGYIGRDPRTGKSLPYTTFRGLGTSGSTPLVAGIVADAEQTTARPLGFLNPLLYSLAGTRAFHDIQPLASSAPQVDRAFYTPGGTEIDHHFAFGYLVGINDAAGGGTHQVTAAGYDTVTGLGTPGATFIMLLRSSRSRSATDAAKPRP